MLRRACFWVGCTSVVLGAACSRDVRSIFSDTGGSQGGGGGAGATGSTGGAGATTSGGGTQITGGSSSSGSPCAAGPDEDVDADGFSISEGDCNDCDPKVSPAAVELFEGDPQDENCDGNIDEKELPCDAGLGIDDLDAIGAAKAIGLCEVVPASPHGVVTAKWVRADGFPAPTSPGSAVAAYHAGHGLVPSFGTAATPLEGTRMLALSTGTARAPGQPGHIAPSPGYEKDQTGAIVQSIPSPTCPAVESLVVYDDIALQLELVAPTNVKGFVFSFDFFTAGWPYDVCSKYDDFFITYLSVPFQPPFVNIAVDEMGGPITLNAALLDACGCSSGPPCIAPPSAPKKPYDCASGTAPLLGTGFEGSSLWSFGGTDWLVTGATLVPGEPLTVRFTTGEGGDGLRDSTVLVDDWQWVNQQPTGHGPE